MRVLIAGAGIGGLTAALCLRTLGHDVQVFERSAALSEIGAGIQLGANAVKVLYALGLEEALDRVAVKPERTEIRRFDNGEPLVIMPLGAAYEQANGAPYLHIHRGDLHAILARAVAGSAPDGVRLSAEATGFVEADDSVTLELADGRRFVGDLLIGADGIRSAIRDQIVGEAPCNWTGCAAWRATVSVDRLPRGLMDRVVTNFVGPRKHVVLYYLRSMQLLNLVGVVENDAWRDESWTVKAPWQELKADYAGWNDTVQQVIDAVDRDECYRWALFNRLPVDNWSTRRATLLGDAAHATLPFMAAGAAMTIEDAMVLARALERESEVSEALQLYQRSRLSRTARIQTQSTAMGEIYHQPEAVTRSAFERMRLTRDRDGAPARDWLASYDPLTVELV